MGRKIRFTEEQLKYILKHQLKENNDQWLKIYDYMEDYNDTWVLEVIKDGKNLWAPLINPASYQKALIEYQKFGSLNNFPSKYVYQWMGIILKNVSIIDSITTLAGHNGGGFDPDSIISVCFDGDQEEYEKYKQTLSHKGNYSPDFGWMEDDGNGGEVDDWEACSQYLDDNGYYNKMTLPDGSSAWSDYGLSPLFKIVSQYNDNTSPEDTLVLINKALDVTHQRGDLASAFIQGGSATLSKISDASFVNENKMLKEISSKYLKPAVSLQQYIMSGDVNGFANLYNTYDDATRNTIANYFNGRLNNLNNAQDFYNIMQKDLNISK